MKKIDTIFGKVLFCTTVALAVSCSSDNDENIQSNTPLQEVANAKTYTIGAPSVQTDASSSKTRAVFADEKDGDSKTKSISIKWVTGDSGKDQIRIRAYKEGNTSAGDDVTPYITSADGLTGSFSISHSWTEPETYAVALGTNGNDFNWNGITTDLEQTQSGNANMDHIKTYYKALLTGLTSLDNIKFSSEGGATFQQSSILKFDLKLPSTFTGTVQKVVLFATNAQGVDQKIFCSRNDGNDSYKSNAITLNIDACTLGDDKHLEGYFVLSSRDLTIPAGTILDVRVYYGGGTSDYLSKSLTYSSESILTAGSLGVISSTSAAGWEYNQYAVTWTFDSFITKAENSYLHSGKIYSSTDKDAVQIDSNNPSETGYKLYLTMGNTNSETRLLYYNTGASSATPVFNGVSMSAVSYHVRPTNKNNSNINESFYTSAYRSVPYSDTDNGVKNETRGLITVNVSKAGKLYVWATENSTSHTARIDFTPHDGYTTAANNKMTSYTLSAENKAQQITQTATGQGQFYINSSDIRLQVWAVKFVPYM